MLNTLHIASRIAVNRIPAVTPIQVTQIRFQNAVFSNGRLQFCVKILFRHLTLTIKTRVVLATCEKIEALSCAGPDIKLITSAAFC